MWKAEEDGSWSIDKNKEFVTFLGNFGAKVGDEVIEERRRRRGSYPAIFHCSLVLELLKLKPDDYPSILVQTVEVIYRRADSMQPICLDRMVDWFSFHLSNFQYRI
ncbi:hypothetical protein CRE_07018 [Caenorhabditis remanei]|uniref:MIF4G-like type 1 domain-containing protein n=1 Tax=Caenorhabditis remanei TaxID=31234 RepID=E3NEH6_CAERE|nr:hypothetical protein CRE_07018 [Caenorhabditis remanei]